jgi:rare lipoprotein A
MWQEEGLASYYNNRFEGRRTASGQRYRRDELTAAHRSLPFGSVVRVWRTDIADSDTVEVRINDRGPHARARIMDLSYAAAVRLGMIRKGVVRVRARLVVPLAADTVAGGVGTEVVANPADSISN